MFNKCLSALRWTRECILPAESHCVQLCMYACVRDRCVGKCVDEEERRMYQTLSRSSCWQILNVKESWSEHRQAFDDHLWGSSSLWTTRNCSEKHACPPEHRPRPPLQRSLTNNRQVVKPSRRGEAGFLLATRAGRDQCLLNNTELGRKKFFPFSSLPWSVSKQGEYCTEQSPDGELRSLLSDRWGKSRARKVKRARGI